MKCINGEKKITQEEIDHIASLIGSAKVSCEDGTVVAKPANNEELGEVVASAMSHGVSVYPLSRKSRHTEGALLVDMSEMANIIDIDKEHMTVKVQAGCKFKALMKAVDDEGFTLGVVPAGKDPTVEDWIYTEEAGIGSYKYGTVKDSVYNICAVDINGGLLVTGFDDIGYYMSGYNLIQTICASSARLAIVSEVTFKLHPKGVTKAVAYELPDTGKMAEAFAKIAHEPSLKPLQISFNGNLAVMAFQGDEEFVDLDIQMADELMASFGAAKADQSVADDKFGNIDVGACVCPTAATMYIPLKEMGAYIAAVKEVADFAVAGNVPDRSTVCVKLTGDVGDDKYAVAADKAEAAGGRSSLRCPSRYRDEPTQNFVKRIEKAFMEGKVEEPTLSRKVDDRIIAELKAIVGDKNVTTSAMDKVLYCHDMAPLPKEAGIAFNNMPDVIVRPDNVMQISKIVALAHAHGIPVTPRGSASWGLGGCMPTAGGIVLDMSSKMKKVVEINEESMYVKVQAGCTWKNLLEACMKKGYIIGSYPSSFPSGTIGAWYSTNGMGIGSYKYGSARENVLNAEVVVDDGTIVTTGWDDMGSYRAMFNLNQFFSGAEGTLGFIATFTMRIYPMGQVRCLAYEFDALKDMNGPMQALVANASVRPLHVAWSDYLHFQNQHRAGVHAPDVKNLWLVTVQGDEKHNDLEEAAVTAMAEAAGGRKIADEIAEHEWEERCYEFRARKVGVGESPAEVIVPTVNWGEFTDDCYNGFKEMKMEAGGVIGVLVDRSTALFMPYYFKDDELLTGMLSFGFNFYLGDVAARYGGRSTGFGVFFAWAMDVIHNHETAAMTREIKTVLDPNDVVNPGHVTCGMTRFGVDMNKSLMSMGSALMQIMKKLFPADKTFEKNLARFRYDDLEHIKTLDRVHKLGDGTQ